MTQQDDKLKALFQAARRADRAEVPAFGTVQREATVARGRAWRWIGLPALGAVATVALAGMALWVSQDRAPQETPPQIASEPRAVERVEQPVVTPPPPMVAPLDTTPSSVPSPQAPPASEPSTPPAPAPPPAPAVAPTAPEARSAASPSPVTARPTRRTIDLSLGMGGILTVVTDSQGDKLPGATVTIEGALVKTTSKFTNKRGEWSFPVLPAEQSYSITVSFPGYTTVRHDDLRVRRGQTLTVPVQLAESLVEQVRVAATRDVIDLDKSETSSRFTDEFIADLPVAGRSYSDVLTMAPGVQDSDGDGNPNVHGARSRDSQIVSRARIMVAQVKQRKFVRAAPLDDDLVRKLAALGYVGDAEAFEPAPGFNTEAYDPIEPNRFKNVSDHPLSTFSVDVDTASYANVRRFLNEGRIPPADAVRVEELINYFTYDDPAPTGEHPFSVTAEVASCPWEPDHRLMRIGLRGEEVSRGELGGSNLVFLIDVSGSMNSPNKLPLVKQSLRMLVQELNGNDRLAMVVYAGATGVVLESTPGSDKRTILKALGKLRSGGSTNGGAGLKLAYKIASENFIEGGVNRVILATDGDFNVGITNHTELLESIRKDADRGIFLTALGFGMGNYKDAMLQTLADRGNGNHAYIDGLREARKVLVEEVGGTLVTIAKDVKIQVEFNPREVAAYRLIGYENRMLAKEDFNDDTKDAGEIGAGHTVTALYEIVPAGMEAPTPAVDELKYQRPLSPREEAGSGEMLTVKLRYKEPQGSKSRLLDIEVTDDGSSIAAASEDLRFAASVAAFGMALRGDTDESKRLISLAAELAEDGRGADPRGYREEFSELIDRARELGGW